MTTDSNCDIDNFKYDVAKSFVVNNSTLHKANNDNKSLLYFKSIFRSYSDSKSTIRKMKPAFYRSHRSQSSCYRIKIQPHDLYDNPDQSPKKQRKSSKSTKIVVNLTNCKYPLVYDCVKQRSWKIQIDHNAENGNARGDKLLSNDSSKKPTPWNIYWTDCSVSCDRVSEMRNYQKINHFPGMHELSRKTCLARNLKKMREVFPMQYDFYPRTWILPKDWTEFNEAAKTLKTKCSFKVTFIVKPDNSSQGKGIFLTQKIDKIDNTVPQVVQLYIRNPYLIDSCKFDLRLYVLIISIDPLAIYIYKDGLVRICTKKYSEPTESNISSSYTHLTNYSLNKYNTDFKESTEFNDSGGNKRSIKWLMSWLLKKGEDVDKLWMSIHDLVIKTITTGQPAISQAYKSCTVRGDSSKCFELLGFDILIDDALKPWLIEVNHSPSFSGTSPLDKKIKNAVINSSLDLINVTRLDKRKDIKQSRRESRSRLYAPKPLSGLHERKSTIKKDYMKKFYSKQSRIDSKNLGEFEPLYPTANRIKMEEYLTLWKFSKGLFLNETGSVIQSHSIREVDRRFSGISFNSVSPDM